MDTASDGLPQVPLVHQPTVCYPGTCHHLHVHTRQRWPREIKEFALSGGRAGPRSKGGPVPKPSWSSSRMPHLMADSVACGLSSPSCWGGCFQLFLLSFSAHKCERTDECGLQVNLTGWLHSGVMGGHAHTCIQMKAPMHPCLLSIYAQAQSPRACST